MDRWMDGWMDGRKEGRKEERKEGKMDESMEWMDGWKDEWMVCGSQPKLLANQLSIILLVKRLIRVQRLNPP
jgi:hypothetical protein